MKDLKLMGVQEMNSNEMKKSNGGISIIRIVGLLDGVKGNTEIYIFNKRVK